MFWPESGARRREADKVAPGSRPSEPCTGRRSRRLSTYRFLWGD